MNVALMVCGHFRNFHITKPYWEKFLQKNECDIFISTWEDYGNRNATEWIDSQENKINFNHITDVMQPKSYLIENVQEKNKNFTLRKNNNSLWFVIGKFSVECDDFSTYIVSQLYKIKTCFDLVEKYAIENNKKYDLVFKLRADTFPENFSLEKYSKIKQHLDNNVLFCYKDTINKNHVRPQGGCNNCMKEYAAKKRTHHSHTNDVSDYFNYGNYDVMKKLAQIYDNVDILYERMEKHNLSVWKPNDKNVIYQPETNKYFVKHGSNGFAQKYKCIYPEKFIREHLQNYWILDDHFLSYISLDFDTYSYNLRKSVNINFEAHKTPKFDNSKLKFL